MFSRVLELEVKPRQSFFLWGPRQSGKSFLLNRTYPDQPYIDLLKSDVFSEYQRRPALLRERARAQKWRFVIIDEIQKVPALLDEVHYLIENEGVRFGLCGSSARKLRRGHANLLGGRALKKELFGLVSSELKNKFDLVTLLNDGYLPAIYGTDNASLRLKAYVGDYLKEEIFAEGLVRSLAPFSQFLELAAMSDTEILSFESFARDVGKSAATIRSYFDILSDTLVGSYLPAYVARAKRRVKKSPKFYFADVGVVNSLAQRSRLEPRSELFGKAFENWVHHELKSYLAYNSSPYSLSYWALSGGIEVDFIVGHMMVAIEAKASSRVNAEHLKGLRAIREDHPKLTQRFVVSLESESRMSTDGILILSVEDFIRKLWSHELIRS